ncbi:MAG: histidine triad nucleotide-binding protein [Chloroflexi bacterium]|nr:histidine triad nucleotide-binding protein [Chloroflexota bacterium]
MSDECIFCKINRGEIPSDILYRDDDCFVIRDIAPRAPVHLLVIPTVHFTYLSGLSDEFQPVLGRMFMTAKEMAAREGVADSGYRLVINQGPDSGQEVPHLHLHVLGGRHLGRMA